MQPKELQERELLHQCLLGSSGAWRTFIKQYSSLVYYIVQKVLKSKCTDVAPEEIDDVHNDVFVSIMDKNGRKLRQYKGKNGCTVSTWIRIIAVRVTIDHIRKKRTTVSLSSQAPEREVEKQTEPTIDPLKHLENEEQKKILKGLIEQLPPKDQLFLRLFYYEETPPKEIAKIFQSTINAVYSRGNYLREKLKQSLKNKISKKNT